MIASFSEWAKSDIAKHLVEKSPTKQGKKVEEIEEHTEDKLHMTYIKLSEAEKKELCDKGSLVGTDAKNPKKGLCDYVEQMINRYASNNFHIGEVNEMIPMPQPKKIDRAYVNSSSQTLDTWFGDVTEALNSLLKNK